MQKGVAYPPGSDRYRYLPILSLMLVVAAGALLLWHFMPGAHRKRVSALDSAMRLVRKHYLYDVDEDVLFKGAMMGLVGSLGDPHSAYLDLYGVEQADAETQGEFGGIGVTVAPSEAGAVVVELHQDGPAMKAGVKQDDLIVGVDGLNKAGMPFAEFVGRIRGKVGSTVQLTIQRAPTGETETLQVTRARLKIESVSWKMVEPGIGYIKIEGFDEHCAENVRKGLVELQGNGALKGLILDVRGNAGGLLKQAVEVSDLFLSEGIIVGLESRLSAERVTFKAQAEVAVPPDLVVVVLVDGGSASASEVFAGSLKSNGRATVIGTRTFGKGAVNRLFRLPDESGGLYLTVAHYTVGSGTPIEGKGIEPDIEVGRLPEYPAGGGDEERTKWRAAYRAALEEQLQRAVQFIKEKAK